MFFHFVRCESTQALRCWMVFRSAAVLHWEQGVACQGSSFARRTGHQHWPATGRAHAKYHVPFSSQQWYIQKHLEIPQSRFPIFPACSVFLQLPLVCASLHLLVLLSYFSDDSNVTRPKIKKRQASLVVKKNTKGFCSEKRITLFGSLRSFSSV